MDNIKAAGEEDEITVDMFKDINIDNMSQLQSMFNKVWKEEKVPSKWKKESLLKHHTHTHKGNFSDCNNLTISCVKSICKVILNRIKDIVDAAMREKQAGFRKGEAVSARSLL